MAFTGSVTCLFTSKWATDIARSGDYGAPVRRFSFDPMYNDMDNMPPGTPRLVTPVLSDWQLVRD